MENLFEINQVESSVVVMHARFKPNRSTSGANTLLINV